MKNDQYFKLSACIMANDQVIGLTEELGIEGFGLFVSLLLELRQRDDYRCAIRSLEAIARRLNTTKELLLRVVYHFGLFCVDEDEQLFSSPYMDEVMGNLEIRRKKQAVSRENGLKGGRPPKCPKEVEKPTEKPAEEPNSKPTEKPNRKPNSKPTPSETPMNTGLEPNQNPVEKSKEEKRTSSSTTTEAGVELKTKVEEPISGKIENATLYCPKSWSAFLDEAFRDYMWVEIQAMQSGCGMPFMEHMEAVKKLFHTHVIAQGTGERLFSAADVRSYFSNFNRPGTPTHLRLVELLKRSCVPSSRSDPYRYEQHNPVDGQRSYCGCFIPADAPPRPTENSVWSDELKEWG